MRAPKLRGVLALSLCSLFLPRSLHAAGAWDRNGFDADDLASLSRRDPALGTTFLRGEAELRSGAIQAAAASFKQVLQRAPDNALAGRRYCQALTELGDRQGAIAACEASVHRHSSPPSFRAAVHALMSAPPKPEELDIAAKLAAAAQQHMDDQPWGLAAKGDIAERTGDEKMLESIVVELERIAPGHYETVRARRALNGFRLPIWAWGVWLAVGLAIIGTAVHAAVTAVLRLRARYRLSTLTASVALVLCSQLLAQPASAQSATPEAGGLSKWPVNDADPKKSVPTPKQRDANPLEFGYHMMDLADKADIAKRKGDFHAVAKYYEAMAVAVPDRAIGYRRSCDAYEQIGDLDKALELCRGALAAEGVELSDYTHFAKLVLGKPGALTIADTEDLTQIATHLKADPGTMAAGLQVQCQLAQRLDDVKRLEDCAEAVAKETPNDPKLVIYQWGIAMKKEDYQRAQALIESARKSSLRPAGIEMMERMTREQSALGRRIGRAIKRHPLPAAIVLTVLLAASAGVWIRRRFRVGVA